MRPLPADTARGVLEIGDYDWSGDTFVPFGDDPQMNLTYGPQAEDFCMIQPSVCVDADWLSGEIQCMRVSWVNELLDYPSGPAPSLDETPSIGVRFRRVDAPDGPRYCAYSIWNALRNCDLGGARLRVTAEVQDARDHHAHGVIELTVGSPY